MEKMRWFIIGNLIGFGVLIVGIGINESVKQKAAEPQADQQRSQTIDQRTVSQTGQKPSSSQQSDAPAVTASGSSAHAASPGKGSENSNSATNAEDGQEAAQHSANGTASVAGTNDKVKTTARLVTTRDISRGTVLHAGDIELRQVDVKLASKDGLTKFDMALGFKTRIDLVEGEMIEPSDLQTRETD
jgi:flagella basal body P-ring formation protein FlgA